MGSRSYSRAIEGILPHYIIPFLNLLSSVFLGKSFSAAIKLLVPFQSASALIFVLVFVFLADGDAVYAARFDHRYENAIRVFVSIRVVERRGSRHSYRKRKSMMLQGSVADSC